MKPAFDQKTFNQGLFVTAIWSLVAVTVVFSTALWAPGLYRTVGAVGNSAFRPWIYFFPILVVPLFALLLEPGYRNSEAITGFCVGAVLVLGLGYLVLYWVPGISFSVIKI